MSTVIKIENLGKQYRLGKVGTGTISNDVNRWWHRVRGKEDPYLKIGEVNDRTKKSENNDIVWAIKDINFEVKRGDVLGIIGRNGAGKSTLLKILSRVTGPTLGNISVKGRIASLLEVGTGFHPELTGRENIFLNGAILGMTKQEIKSKFDEIVDFSGVERYIDTPVKRYSSGMYVRLAFAVAAHLEPDILIVDEVLAVGDVEFQKKCLGKMKDVSGQGRTVLFVSHNMAAIKALCNTGLYLKNGRMEQMGDIEDVITAYLSHSTEYVYEAVATRKDKLGNKSIEVVDVIFKTQRGEATSEIFSGDGLTIELHIKNHANIRLNELIFACGFADKYENKIVNWVSDEMNFNYSDQDKITLRIPHFNVRSETYYFNYQISHKSTKPEDFCDVLLNAAALSVLESDFFKSGKKIRQGSSLLLPAFFE